MSELRPITIIGGGLAGLTLGITLRQRNVPVLIREAGHYPRHRVCGEFVNGSGRQTLEQLGLAEPLRAAGTCEAHNATFRTSRFQGPVRRLPQPALCISRFKLDALLAERFRSLGGELQEGERWPGNANAEGMIQATGRRVQSAVGGWRWFGLKVHARNVRLDADLEMHLTRGGYVGLTRLVDGVVNVCGLFRRRAAIGESAPRWQDHLLGQPGSWLRERLANAVFDDSSFCAVAGLDLRPQPARTSESCRIGDALTMIPPVTGNGMSMAFESAALAATSLERWSRGDASWSGTRNELAVRSDAAFARRLAWARWLQNAMFVSACQPVFVRLLTGPGWMWRYLFSRTR